MPPPPKAGRAEPCCTVAAARGCSAGLAAGLAEGLKAGSRGCPNAPVSCVPLCPVACAPPWNGDDEPNGPPGPPGAGEEENPGRGISGEGSRPVPPEEGFCPDGDDAAPRKPMVVLASINTPPGPI